MVATTRVDFSKKIEKAALPKIANIVDEFYPKKADIKQLKSALAAMASHHMPVFVAQAFSNAGEVDIGSISQSSLDSGIKGRFHTSSSMGWFMEDIHEGYIKDRTGSLADFNMQSMSKQIAAVDAEFQRNSSVFKKGSKELVYGSALKGLSDYMAGFGEEAGIEVKTYSTTKQLHVGQFTVYGEHNKEDIYVEAFKKIFKKMNTLYLMSVWYTYGNSLEKVRLNAANLFHELIFDRVVREFVEGFIKVDIVKVKYEKTPGSKKTIAQGSYSIKFDWSSLENRLTELAKDITAQYKYMEKGTAGRQMSEARMYRYNEVLYQSGMGRTTDNFFIEVLRYYYAKTGQFIVLT